MFTLIVSYAVRLLLFRFFKLLSASGQKQPIKNLLHIRRKLYVLLMLGLTRPTSMKEINMSMLILLGIVAIVLIYGISLYNNLVSVKNAVAKAWANIDVLLKQRHDELPKLVEVCKQYKQFEQSTLQKVIEARSQVQSAGNRQDIDALGQAEGVLRAGLGRIFALAEAYPELKANENFMQLQNRISTLENGIADRREFYNDAVNINNVQIEVFPANFLSKMFGFEEKPLLVFSTKEKADVDMKQLFN